MKTYRNSLLSGTVIPLALGAGIGLAGIAAGSNPVPATERWERPQESTRRPQKTRHRSKEKTGGEEKSGSKENRHSGESAGGTAEAIIPRPNHAVRSKEFKPSRAERCG